MWVSCIRQHRGTQVEVQKSNQEVFAKAQAQMPFAIVSPSCTPPCRTRHVSMQRGTAVFCCSKFRTPTPNVAHMFEQLHVGSGCSVTTNRHKGLSFSLDSAVCRKRHNCRQGCCDSQTLGPPLVLGSTMVVSAEFRPSAGLNV